MGLINDAYIYYPIGGSDSNQQFITGEEYKRILKNRNIYTSSNKYPLEPSKRQKIINETSNIINLLQPFETYDLKNTVYARLITLPNTPIVDIGLKMLGKQMVHNTQSKLGKDILPDVSLRNLFNEKDIISFNKDFTITNPVGKEGWFNRFLNSISNFYPKELSPFGSYSKHGTYSNDYFNEELKNNTGSAQLDILSTHISHNRYVETYNSLSDEFIKLFGRVKYDPQKDDSDKEFDHTAQNTWIGENNIENINNRLIWGRDGITDSVNERISALRGIDDSELLNYYDKFEIKRGLLNVTRNVLNNNDGDIIDITRKVFKEKGTNKISGFQGSPMWKAPNTAPSGVRGKIGIRQHTVLDPYNNFAKTIRFNGNKLYGGNSNSVIHKSVLPRIHPTIDGFNSKNLMFSIENLAVRAISKDNEFGLIDDGTNEGIFIPASEVGPFMGRIMWFPPYAIEFNETINNTFETTTMMGRGEPIYNYQYTERGGNIRFVLLIDHPSKINELETHKDVAEFFSFGGYGEIDVYEDISKLEERKKELEKEIEKLSPKISEEPEFSQIPSDILVVFPNDYPKPGGVNDIFSKMYNKYSYEIRKDVMSIDGTSFGLNENIFCFDEKHLVSVNMGGNEYQMIDDELTIDQYTCNTLDTKLNEVLFDFFNNEKNRELYKIEIIASATRLYYDSEAQAEYNQKLSERRAEATKILLKKRIRSLIGESADSLGIQITTNSVGSVGSSESFATVESISERGAKEERSARISFVRNEKPPEEIDTTLTSEEQEQLESYQTELEKLTEDIENRKQKIKNKTYKNRETSEDAILDNFSSITENKYYPVFHSQTPEEFHRRLTFLQQCMRQGRAASRNIEQTEGGILRARNSVFGRQPVSVLRIGDFFHTKIIIETLTIDYDEAPWDMNPEGFGMQPMLAEITLQVKMIGGQSLDGPIAALQNAIAFNHYANSTYTNKGVYKHASDKAEAERLYRMGVNKEKEEEIVKRYDHYFSE